MKTIHKSLFLFLVALFVNSIFAQTIVTSKSYETDFEDEAEREKWTLNVGTYGSKCVNRWFWGQAGANGGTNGLFLSKDGISNDYEGQGVSVVAMRTIILDKGDYELSFDWKAGGSSNYNDGLYVCWIPDSVNVYSTTTFYLQPFVLDNAIIFSDSIRLIEQNWNSIVADKPIHSDGTPHKLVFVWNNNTTAAYPGACIDNINIQEKGLCSRPIDFKVNPKGTDVLLSWIGDAASYDVKIYCYKTSTWFEYKDITDKYLVVKGLEEGSKVFFLRSKCDDGTHSAWISKEIFLHFPDMRCIDYLSLTNQNCFYGNISNPKSKKGFIDKGSKSKFSRHTLHSDTAEYDARTNNGLKTVPAGELASVRIGNWDIGAEAEAIVYDYTVDSTKGGVLLLNYAVVLQDPGHFPEETQPRFSLSILKNGARLDKYGCGEAYFAAGFDTDDSSWHTFYGLTQEDPGGVWKDWTTVAINLSQYHGEHLQINLTSYDCSQSGHYGYAYFTLGCSSGKIEGLGCGESPTSAFQGPEGFDYRWYLPSNPDSILSTEKDFVVTQDDTLTYYLDVIQPTNPDCYYTLTAAATLRWPHAGADYTHSVVDCQNIVTFNNTSCIVRENQVTHKVVRTAEECESFFWDFGDGTTSYDENPTHVYSKGGTYTVTLSAGIADGKCFSDTVFTLNLPDLSSIADTLYASTCKGMPYFSNGEYLFNSGVYVDSATTAYGCDSVSVLILSVFEPVDITIFDTICSHEEYYFDGDTITETGTYVANYKTINNCDSNVTLNIIVSESLILDFDTLVSVCGGDASVLIPYQKTSGLLAMCEASIDFGDSIYSVMADVESQSDAVVLPMPEKVEPGYYTLDLNFGENACGDERKTIPMQILYPKDIVVQRWGDVLAVTNENYNGGYEFTAFQWYKNGTPIEGATSSIFYMQDGLDLNAQYAVLLTRASDSVSVMTCIADLFDNSSISDSYVVVFNEDSRTSVEVSNKAKMKIWTVNGFLVKVCLLWEGYNNISETGLNGIYLLEFIFEDGHREIKQVRIN